MFIYGTSDSERRYEWGKVRDFLGNKGSHSINSVSGSIWDEKQGHGEHSKRRAQWDSEGVIFYVEQQENALK